MKRCIPFKANAAFVCQMEDVLKVYKLPYDFNRPVLSMDEMTKQLLADNQARSLVRLENRSDKTTSTSAMASHMDRDS